MNVFYLQVKVGVFMKSDKVWRIANHFCIGFKGSVFNDELRRLIEEYHINKFILFSENLPNEKLAKKLIADIKDEVHRVCDKTATIMIDQEGGAVSRLPDDKLNIPSAMALMNIGYDAVYRMHNLNAKVLKEYGVNFNLAPVADVNSEKSNPIIGARSFSELPEIASQAVSQAIRAYKDAKLLCAVKHFPGHGNVTQDSHIVLPQNNVSYKELRETELKPFVQAIADDVDAILLAHILLPQIEDNDLPASLSKKICQKILRDELSFEGVLVSDCMEMKAISKNYPSEFAAKLALEASMDILIFSHSPDIAENVINKLSIMLDNGLIDIDTLNKSDKRLLKYENLLSEYENYREFVDMNNIREEINNCVSETIKECGYINYKQFGLKENLENKKHLAIIGPRPVRLNEAYNSDGGKKSFASSLADHFKCDFFDIDINPNKDQIKTIIESLTNYETIVVGMYQARLFKGQMYLIEQLTKVNKKILFVALRDPYDIDYLHKINNEAVAICVYEYSEKSINALINLIEKRLIDSSDIK